MDPTLWLTPELTIYFTRRSVSDVLLRGTGWLGKHWFKLSTERPKLHLFLCLILSACSIANTRSNQIERPIENVVKLHIGAAVLYVALTILGILEYPEEFPGILKMLERKVLNKT